MKLRLKEDPREWRKFAWSTCGVALAIVAILSWRKTLPPGALAVAGGLALGVSLVALVRPTWFRSPYRAGMKASNFLGRIMGRLTLWILFLLLVVPLGVLMRCLGSDPLGLRRNQNASSYWRVKTHCSDLDRAF